MADNDWKARLGMVYSTDPGFKYETADEPEAETLLPARQDLQELARLLKTKCGVGGAAKEGEIIIQGDHRDRVVDILTRSGYRCKKAGN